MSDAYLASRSVTNQSSSRVGCRRRGCPGIEPGTSHVESDGGFSCLVLPGGWVTPAAPVPPKAPSPFEFPAVVRPYIFDDLCL